MINHKDLQLGQKVLDMAQKAGAQNCRMVLNRSTSDLLDTLNGSIDKVTRCMDCNVTLSIFADGRFGTFSTNDLTDKGLEDFILTAVKMTRMLNPDGCRTLPSPERYFKGPVESCRDILKLHDPQYYNLDGEKRKEMALKAALDMGIAREGFKIISEEGQYGDSEFDSLTMDSQGLVCAHEETSFEYASEITIEAPDGTKQSSYWWTSSPMLKDFKPEGVGEKALRRAVQNIGSAPVESRKCTMVVSRDAASKLVTPLLNALGGYALQQNNSFLTGSLGKKMFSEGLSIIDMPQKEGESGSRLFDSEGIAAVEMPVIENGVVRNYFINTYISNKTGMAPTIEDAIRPVLQPFPERGLTEADILKKCGDGILVTGFNGGNCNSATGDFSYGVEGFCFKDGKLERPVCEMLITGNFLSLWANLLYAGEDARPCMAKLIPTLAFADVDFNGE